MTLFNSNDPKQLGFGNPQTARDVKQPLWDSIVDLLKNNCLGMGSKVPEEIAALKLAMEVHISEVEHSLLARIMPEGVKELLQDKGLAAINAGVNMQTALVLWPHLAHETWADKVQEIQAWRQVRTQLRLMSRFEHDVSTAGLAAIKLWEDTQRTINDNSANGGTVGDAGAEPELRDAIIDDDNLTAQVLTMHLRLAQP